jgi:hypothetical protein
MANTGTVQLSIPTNPVAPAPTTGGVLQQTGSAIPADVSGPTPTKPVDPVKTFTPALASGVAATATGYTATPYTVNKESTVQGQLEGILAKGSPLMTLADLNAQQGANSRGLLNSSIAEGARENAVIANAMPIAQQDANAQFTAMTKTADAVNTERAANAAAVNSASSTNAQLLTALNKDNANAVNNALSQTAQAANQRALQLITSNTQIELANLQAENQQILQANVNAANGFSSLIQQIASIQNNPQLDGEAKETNVRSLINNYNQFLQTTAAISKTNQQNVESLNLDGFFSNPSFVDSASGQSGGSRLQPGTPVGASEFDAQRYLQDNPDVARAGVDAWTHYMQYGRNEGRVAYKK